MNPSALKFTRKSVLSKTKHYNN